MNLNGIIEFIEPDMKRVEAYIHRQLAAPVQVITEIFEYTVGAGGKRLRPALCLLSANAVGQVNEDAISLGGNVELVHTVTLIHDDIVDESHTRRGKTTANAKWGNEITVLVGDYMFSKVFVYLTADGFHPWTSLLAQTTTKMSAGELLEIEFRRKWDLTEEEYFRLIQYKTAELMAAACQVGGMAAGGSGPEIEALKEYGLNFGMAFQVTDDLLDIVGDNQRLGKPVWNDLREGKVTLPLIHALETAPPADREQILQLVSREQIPQHDIDTLISPLICRYGVEYSRGLAAEFANKAKAAASSLPDSRGRKALIDMAEFVVSRNR